MQSLQRLTGSVLARSALVHVQQRRTILPALAVRGFGSLSGKETSYGEELDSIQETSVTVKKTTVTKRQGPGSPSYLFPADAVPGALRPDGSNSEEIVAGDRSDIDPLAEIKKRRAPRDDKVAPEAQDIVKKRAPSLTEVDEEEEDVVRGGPTVGP